MKCKMLLFLIASIWILGGCASTTQFVPSASGTNNIGMSHICLYRESSFAGAANTVHVWDNGKKIAKIGPGGYVFWERKPGRFVLRVRDGGISGFKNFSDIVVEAEPNKTYYIHMKPTSSDNRLTMLDELEGEKFKEHCFMGK